MGLHHQPQPKATLYIPTITPQVHHWYTASLGFNAQLQEHI